MSARAKNKKTACNGEQSTPRKRGRPPLKRASEYAWYRGVEGFQVRAADSDKFWWEDIDWVKKTKMDKAARFFKPPEAGLKRVLHGFLWETARRHPDMKELLDLWAYITGKDLEGCNLCSDGKPVGEALALTGERSIKKVSVINQYGMNLYDALHVLCTHWKLDYESLDKEEKERWLNCYQDLWHQLGEPGSVPAMPPDLPQQGGPDFGIFFGQGITAFELLIETNKGEGDPGLRFLQQPIPSLRLDLVAIQSLDNLNRSREKLKALGPKEEIPHEFADPKSYPWVSIGRLDGFLAQKRLYQLMLAVDLSKNDEMILRDLMQIVKRKRKLLGVAVAVRRIRKESFDKIALLDKEVLEGDAPPHMGTCNEFKKSSRLDFRPLIDCLKQIKESPYDSRAEAESFIQKLAILQKTREELSRSAPQSPDQSKAFGLLTGKPVLEDVIRGLET